MPFGLLLSGFAPMTLSDIKADLEAAWRAEFGDNADLSPDSPDGQVIGIMAERFALLWELGQAVYNGYAPDFAQGQALDEVCAITATVRKPASKSTVTLTATGTNGTVLTTGREVSVADTGDRFVTTAPATLVTLTSWAALTLYVTGDRRTNGGNSYIVTIGGTSAGAGGPSGTGTSIVDGSVTWRYLGAGAAAIDVAAEAAVTGPVQGVAFSITTIETPVSGWSNVTNLLDASPGTNVESDPALRIRREIELGSEGAATLNAIRAAVLRVEGVSQAVVFQNFTSSPSSDTPPLPPHSVEAVVLGGDDQDLWDAVFQNIAAGIEPFGSETGSSLDESGASQFSAFSRPTELDIYLRIEVTVSVGYPTDGDDQIKAAVVAAGDLYRFGQDVHGSAVSAHVFEVDGILNVTAVKLSTAPSPSSTASISVEPRELAVFDTSRIQVVTALGIP